MSQTDKLISISGFTKALTNIKNWVTDFAARRDHTHYNIENDFAVDTNVSDFEAMSSTHMSVNAADGFIVDAWNTDGEDNGHLYIAGGNCELSSYTYVSSNSISLFDGGIDISAHSNSDEYSDIGVNINSSYNINIDASNILDLTGNEINIKHCGDNDDIPTETAIKVADDITITSSKEDLGHTIEQSTITNNPNQISITTHDYSSESEIDDMVVHEVYTDTNILLHNLRGENSEIVLSVDKTWNSSDDSTGGVVINTTTGGITIGTEDTQSKIELLADNISIKSNSDAASNKVFTTDGGIATLPTIPSALKNPHALTVQGNGTTIGSYDGSSAKTFNITPASIGADSKPFSTVRDFADGTLIKTNIDYSVTNGVPFYVEIKGNTYSNIGSMFIQAQGYIYNDTITNYSVTSLGKIYPEQFIAINVDGNLCFWFPRIGYWHGYSVKVTTGYDYSVNCVTDVINSVEPTGTKRVALSDNYFINNGFDGNDGVSINPAGNWYTPIYINSNNEALPVEHIEDTLIKWKHPDQTNPGTNLQSLFSPIDTAISQLHSANRLAFGNPAGITVEYSTDGGATWIDYGLTDAQKINLISNKSYGTEIRAGKALNTRVTANDKLRITINAPVVGFYTRARALYINFSTNGSDNCIVDVERANRGSETNFTTWKTGLVLNGWSGWNKVPLGGISFGGEDHQTSNVGAIRLTISSNGASSSYTGGCHFSVYDLQLIGDTTWTTCSNMGKTGHLYDYDYNQNAIFPANVTATGFTKKDSSDSYVLLGGGGHKSVSDFAVANHNHTINLTGTFTPNITSSYNNGVLTISASATNVQYTGTTDVENTNANPESWFVNPDDMTAFFTNEVSTISTLEDALNLYMTGE